MVYIVNVRSRMRLGHASTPTVRTGLPFRDHVVEKIAICVDSLHSPWREERQELAAGVCL